MQPGGKHAGESLRRDPDDCVVLPDEKISGVIKCEPANIRQIGTMCFFAPTTKNGDWKSPLEVTPGNNCVAFP
jgi:hypothetical protein